MFRLKGRPLKCLMGHDWGGHCWCTRCGAANHDFAPSGEGHTCKRCGLEEQHDFRLEYRWVAADPGAWDSTFGSYDDIEEEYNRCGLCGYTERTGGHGRIGSGNL